MDKDLIDFESNFSVLDRYGTYITKDEYITNPAIGRDQQIKELILILLTPEKSAILVGKPGIGKTAIVEGLAYRIQQNDIPEALLGYEIVNIKTASLLGTMPSGESKVQKMIDELKNKEKLILFIDEIHMLIGATDSSSLDFANIFKEGLGRGSIKVIGATTTEEYERYILRDKAFTRRFQRVEVPEPSREETIKIMMGTLPKFEKQTGRKMKYTPFIQERIMSFIVDITSEYKRVFALGSRYPDVCLTILKQAFSYTVYDNRPYMDIFDVRKAIENSKNIYPDIIKKELPNFDQQFNDIILEEKGEKPVEEWRKNDTEVESSFEDDIDVENVQSLENNTSAVLINNNVKKRDRKKGNIIRDDFDQISRLKNTPEIIDRSEYNEDRKIKNVKRFARIGSTSISRGLKEKINRTSNTTQIDDFLLSSDMGTLKINKEEGPVLPTKYVVTDEIKDGVDDSFLLRRPIESTNNRVLEEPQEVVKYKNRNKNEGKRMWDDGNRRPERQDLNSQNFDKYSNFFHQGDNNYQNNNQFEISTPSSNEELENAKRIDMLMGKTNSSNMAPNMNNQMNQGPMGGMPPQNMGFGNPSGPMNQGPMGGMPSQNMQNIGFGNPNGPMSQGPIGGMPPQNMQNMGFGNPNGPMSQGPMGGMPPQNMQSMGFGNPNGPMSQGPIGGMPPQNMQSIGFGNPNGPMNQGPMEMPLQNSQFGPRTSDSENKFLDEGKKDNSVETLFGAPMYSSEEKEENEYDKIPDIYVSNNRNNSSFQMPMGGNLIPPNMSNQMPMGGNPIPPNSNSFLPINSQNEESSSGETLFGAPMYSEETVKYDEPKLDTSNIFGNLLSEDMRIKDGKIIDEFPTFDKINNLSQIKSVISDVRESGPQSSIGYVQNDLFMQPNQNPVGVYTDMNMNQNKNWVYLDNNQNQQMFQMQQMAQNPSTFQSNILDSVPKHKEENTISSNTNNVEPTSNRDYYEDMKSGNFVNLTELNSGKIKEEDSNKYMGVQISENKPQFDLNIENNRSEDNGFDDFFE